MSGSGRLALPDVQEWSAVPSECPAVNGRPSRMSGNGREALSNVREWWESLTDIRVFWRPSRMYGSGRDAFTNVR